MNSELNKGSNINAFKKVNGVQDANVLVILASSGIGNHHDLRCPQHGARTSLEQMQDNHGSSEWETPPLRLRQQSPSTPLSRAAALVDDGGEADDDGGLGARGAEEVGVGDVGDGVVEVLRGVAVILPADERRLLGGGGLVLGSARLLVGARQRRSSRQPPPPHRRRRRPPGCLQQQLLRLPRLSRQQPARYLLPPRRRAATTLPCHRLLVFVWRPPSEAETPRTPSLAARFLGIDGGREEEEEGKPGRGGEEGKVGAGEE
uniref:Uncharacterized protein n=1 Tax=Oryza glumipatula TaxID=40148 RepID=A0A0D9ZJH4_9ORYZ